jgi:uncharacterized protein (TIGR02453 family)
MSLFNGFSENTLEFLEDLKRNNSKEWFEAHRPEYEEHVKGPSEQFVVGMGKKLQSLSPCINAVPKVNKSLFRINRDTRFSQADLRQLQKNSLVILVT